MRLRLDLAYDGTGFRGFAENAGVRTVGGELRAAIERRCGQPVRLTCAGRTDAGVHARHQVVTVDVVDPPPPEVLRDALNALVAPEVAVAEVRVVDAGFDARFSATWRRYHYLVRDDPVPDPFTARVAWWVREPLDVAAMELAARSLRGEHDFSSFCRRPDRDPPASLVRRVLHTEWSRTAGGLARFEIVATAFCHQMVRSVVGTLVAVGRGRLPVGRVQELLAARDRAGTPNLAPPHGLTLDRVGYEPWPAGFAGGSG